MIYDFRLQSSVWPWLSFTSRSILSCSKSRRTIASYPLPAAHDSGHRYPLHQYQHYSAQPAAGLQPRIFSQLPMTVVFGHRYLLHRHQHCSIQSIAGLQPRAHTQLPTAVVIGQIYCLLRQHEHHSVQSAAGLQPPVHSENTKQTTSEHQEKSSKGKDSPRLLLGMVRE